jgi:regulatory protein
MNDGLRERALRLLARREHTRVELSRKLTAHAESAEQVDALLDDLTARQLLSDARYAEMRVNSRSARLGNARLAYELRSQGVSEDVVSAALSSSEQEHSELSRARQVWQRKFDQLPACGNHAERSRQMRFLMSRGFSAETIRRVLRGDFEDE